MKNINNDLEKIDIALRALYEKQVGMELMPDVFMKLYPNITLNETRKIQSIMSKEGLIEEGHSYMKYGFSARITEKGNTVILEYGDYTSFLKYKKRTASNITKLQTLNITQTKLKNSLIIISLVSSLLATVSTIWAFYNTKENSRLKELLYKNNIEIPK